MIAEAVIAKLTWNVIGAAACLGVSGYSVAKIRDPYGVRSDFNKVIRASELGVKHGQKQVFYPHIDSYEQPEELEHVHRFRLRLPAGMSWKDFDNKKDKIEQFFGGEVHLHRDGKQIVVEILTKDLSWELPFDEEELFINHFMVGGQTRKTDGLYFTLGESRKDMVRLDLAKFPHLLIGGQTGGGKSVCLRLILVQLLLLQPPENLRLHLIDLKGGIEFDLFERLPHVESFSTTEEQVNDTLDSIIQEYEQRLILFKQCGVVNISDYRALGYSLPYIMVVFDEFAELNPNEVPNRKSKAGEPLSQREIREEIHGKVSRLLRLARATGIHLVIATQRPDANALPGQLKGNIPVTIAFRTRNRLNSQILLESDSAGELPSIAGRAILQIGADEQQCQVMYMSPGKAKELLEDGVEEKKVVSSNSTPEPQEEVDPDLL